MALEQDQRIADVVEREQSRLSSFIRRRVPDPRDAEDILQDVFYELVEANRLLMPIDHVRAGCRVARNDHHFFRKKKPESFSETGVAGEDDEPLQLRNCCSPDAGPTRHARHVLHELELPLTSRRRATRRVVGHESKDVAMRWPRRPA
jgi:DNA-directed RNA polymerase specialized sigma24 family protein